MSKMLKKINRRLKINIYNHGMIQIKNQTKRRNINKIRSAKKRVYQLKRRKNQSKNQKIKKNKEIR